jgi:hypothetical protein
MPMLCSMFCFLLAYALAVAVAFRKNQYGRRRKWLALDYIWVPLGGATGICLLALWWRSHGPM